MEQLNAKSLKTELFDSSEMTLKDIIVSKINDPTMREDADDAFFIGDLGDIIQKHRKWLRNLPRVEPHYAVKCNPDAHVLKLLAGLNIGFDCASKTEIQEILKIGVSPSRIIFANPCKQRSHLKYAAENDVRLMTFDNEAELLKVKKVFPDAKLVLRILTDDSTAQCQLGLKFGCHPRHAPALLRTAQDLELDVVGISFHVGSGCRDPMTYIESIRNSKELFDFGNDLGFKMNLLDIGGGFPGQDSAPIKFEEFATVINQALAENFPVGCGVRVIAEPGRFYVASAFTLAVNITAKRMVARDVPTFKVPESEDIVANTIAPSKCDEPAFMYYVNDGVYGSFNCLLFDHAEVEPTLLKERVGDVQMFSTSIWGPSCDGLDRIIENHLMPELEVGEWLIFQDMGAYTMCASSEFNGFKRPILYSIISKEYLSIVEHITDQPKPRNSCKASFTQLATSPPRGFFDENSCLVDLPDPPYDDIYSLVDGGACREIAAEI
ncbi:ornithine decarboxylase-like [Lytechinus variegatus]|uniref:ornithine decarboxylase-like n=1 Tax=Lytechinus variegatus TaxID=7654 RepID=UPI001BB1CA6D|nr:ornithine decarboxylase-like [Lytechinus variegatus]